MSVHSTPVLRRCVAFFLSALLCGGAAAASESPALSDDPRVADAVRIWKEWVAYQAAVNRVPGLSFGIVHDQEMIAGGGFGAANPAGDIPATTETLYSICSISKLFTSVALMQQRAAGRLRLDDPVAQHLEWFDIGSDYEDAEPVTIRGLLTHSSGLPRESDYPYWSDPEHTFPTAEQIRAKLGEQQTLYPASRYFQYSNLGLTLVGEIVAAVSGQPYDDAMREQLLGPLGMTNTHTDIPVEQRGRSLAIGHSALKRDGTRDVVPPFRARGIAPAAGFASNVEDMARFAMWQFRVLDGEDQVLLNAAALREMQRVHWVDPDWETTWGLGFNVARVGERTYARHGGGCPGYYTEFRLEPKTRTGVIVLTNTIGSSPGLYAQKAFELVGPAIAAVLSDPQDAPARDGGLEAYAGVYTSIWDQAAIVPWKDGLAMLELGSSDPAKDLMRFEPAGEHTFRRVREDDGSQGETLTFEMDEDGRATRVGRHSFWRERMAR